jgi:hypothetical protein
MKTCLIHALSFANDELGVRSNALAAEVAVIVERKLEAASGAFARMQALAEDAPATLIVAVMRLPRHSDLSLPEAGGVPQVTGTWVHGMPAYRTRYDHG